IFCCLSTRRPASSTLFPYTTLFRSQKALALANKVWVAGKNPVAVGIQVVSNNVTDHFTVSDQATGYTAFNNIVTVWCICAEGPVTLSILAEETCRCIDSRVTLGINNFTIFAHAEALDVT